MRGTLTPFTFHYGWIRTDLIGGGIDEIIVSLHSTMVGLGLISSSFVIFFSIKFTFHYGWIRTGQVDNLKKGWRGLHSTMVGLGQSWLFCNTKSLKVYIPLWLD